MKYLFTLLSIAIGWQSFAQCPSYQQNNFDHTSTDPVVRRVVTLNEICCTEWSQACEDQYNTIAQEIGLLYLEDNVGDYEGNSRPVEFLPTQAPVPPTGEAVDIEAMRAEREDLPLNTVEDAQIERRDGFDATQIQTLNRGETISFNPIEVGIQQREPQEDNNQNFLGGECLTVTNGDSPYDSSDPIFSVVVFHDEFCCNVGWDDQCEAEYAALLGGACVDDVFDITIYDNTDPIYSMVVTYDTFCCDWDWDFQCQDEYDAIAGGECVSNVFFLSPYPASDPIFQQVISLDPYCCDAGWDELCDLIYAELESGVCYTFLDGSAPYWPDDPYFQWVVENDPWCCDVYWDEACQSAYDAAPYGTCYAYENGEVPYFYWDTYYQAVVDADSWCCEISWDDVCQAAYYDLNPGACAVYNYGTAPYWIDFDNDDIVLQVLVDDSYCCEVIWDSICESRYWDYYYGCTDFNSVNYNFLAVMDDGSCCTGASSCPEDLNGDGFVTAADLLLMLAAFGSICSP